MSRPASEHIRQGNKLVVTDRGSSLAMIARSDQPDFQPDSRLDPKPSTHHPSLRLPPGHVWASG